MTIYTDPRAADDIEAAAVWLDGINPGSGDLFYDAVDRTLATLLLNPRMYSRVSRPPRGREVRAAPVDGYQFTLTYELTTMQLVVWSVGHARARSQGWRQRMRGSSP